MFHGRAGGHNIMPFLEYFNSSKEHNLTYLYSNDRTYYPKEENIAFYKFALSPLKFLRFLKLIRKPYDLIWYHGGHSGLIFFLFASLRRKKSTFIFNVWNEWLIHKAKKGGIKGWLFKSAVKKSDIVHCNWYGTAEVLRETGWNNNIKVFFWGLHREYFATNTNIELEEETKQFIAALPPQKTKFFFPKSISPNSRHDLVIDAAEELVKNGVEDFVVYFWVGNTNDPELMEKYEEFIRQKGVEEQVKLVRHGFLPFRDMMHIWHHMDSGLQIAANEQLSTTFLEPQFFKKEIVVTDIPPYRIFNDKFPVNIPLVQLNANDIANEMKKIIKGGRTPGELLNQRHQIVKDNFNMYENLVKILEHYSQ